MLTEWGGESRIKVPSAKIELRLGWGCGGASKDVPCFGRRSGMTVPEEDAVKDCSSTICRAFSPRIRGVRAPGAAPQAGMCRAFGPEDPAFGPETRPFALKTRPFALKTRPFALEIRLFALEIRPFALEIRLFALEIRLLALRTRLLALRTRLSALKIRPLALKTRTNACPIR